jgi:hypothetical protein
MALRRARGDGGSGRIAIAAMATALAALAASLGFAASMHRVVTDPHLTGWNWDAFGIASPSVGARLLRDGTASQAISGSMFQVKVGSQEVIGLGLDPGPAGPVMIAGRQPSEADEVALGPSTMRALHTRIGAHVAASFVEFPSGTLYPARAPMHVVGVVAVPQTTQNLVGEGSGAVFSRAALRTYGPPGVRDDAVFLRFARGVGLDEGANRFRSMLDPGDLVLVRAQAADQSNLAHVSALPNVLAGLLGLLAAAALVHTIATTVRRRRRDLAVLKTLGFVRRQLWSTVVAQSATIVAIALVVGIPLGIVGARWGWIAFVDHLDFVPQPVVPALPVGSLIPGALVLGAAIALLPARAAARTQPALVLRSE